MVRVTVAGQASGPDSRLSLIPALTRTHGQPEAANSEPESRPKSERQVSHGHDHPGPVTVRQGLRLHLIVTPTEDTMLWSQ